MAVYSELEKLNFQTATWPELHKRYHFLKDNFNRFPEKDRLNAYYEIGDLATRLDELYQIDAKAEVDPLAKKEETPVAVYTREFDHETATSNELETRLNFLKDSFEHFHDDDLVTAYDEIATLEAKLERSNRIKAKAQAELNVMLEQSAERGRQGIIQEEKARENQSDRRKK